MTRMIRMTCMTRMHLLQCLEGALVYGYKMVSVVGVSATASLRTLLHRSLRLMCFNDGVGGFVVQPKYACKHSSPRPVSSSKLACGRPRRKRRS